MNKKACSAIIAATAFISTAFTSLPFHVNDNVRADSTVKIMCIGDSITDGYGINGSYRKFLYNNLTEMGYTIDMVGAKGGGWTPTYTDEDTGVTFSYDDENTGYSGYAIKEYSGRSGILETLQSTDCLAQTTPDIVILQIGTNDVIDNHELDSAGDRLSDLITYIIGEIPSGSALFVTSIPDLDPNRSDVYSWFGNYRHSSDWQTQYSDDEVEVNVQAAVDTYNSTVRHTVSNLQGTYSNLYIGDVHSAITDVTTQLNDGVHPNNVGYKLMGAYWTTVIDNYLSGSAPFISTTTTTTSTTTTVTETTTTTSEETTTTTTTSLTTTSTSETTTTTSSSTTTNTTTSTTVTSSETITTTTADPDISENGYKISDLVKLQQHILRTVDSNTGALLIQLTAEDAQRYDMNSDGKLNSFDSVLLRKELLTVCS